MPRSVRTLYFKLEDECFGGYRFAHFHRRHFFYGGYYPYYYYPRRCRVIWTCYGARRVCGWHHWHRYW